jgi:ABC-type antimicrobial peptide transport system permease subunit
MVWLGLAAGVAGALILTRVMVSLLYDVTPTDPGVFAGVLAVLGMVALAACLLPAWHATRVNPVRALSAD